jgi:hypothetical protein
VVSGQTMKVSRFGDHCTPYDLVHLAHLHRAHPGDLRRSNLTILSSDARQGKSRPTGSRSAVVRLPTVVAEANRTKTDADSTGGGDSHAPARSCQTTSRPKDQHSDPSAAASTTGASHGTAAAIPVAASVSAVSSATPWTTATTLRE